MMAISTKNPNVCNNNITEGGRAGKSMELQGIAKKDRRGKKVERNTE